MVVNFEGGESKHIWVIYGGKGVACQFGFDKMYWKLIFISGFTNLFGVKFLVSNYACVKKLLFRKSALRLKDTFSYIAEIPPLSENKSDIC